MSISKRLRNSKVILIALTMALPTIGLAPQALAQETYQIVVHVPSVSGVLPADAKITLIDAGNTNSQTHSRLIGQDAFGWFGVVNIPAGSSSVRVKATKLTNSSVAISPSATRELWLNSKGVPYLNETSATSKLKISLVAKGTDLSNRSVKVTIGKSTQTYKFSASGSKRFVLVAVSGSTSVVKFTIFNKTKAGKTYTVNPRKAGKVWVGDSFTGVRTSESWANDKFDLPLRTIT